ncbi:MULTISPECIES: PAS domain-containing protein [unclassified Coleofasciculus]|uniref:PAS domain-containing protein n=1 Tax=unclassified Coleofasciculus TaxID=2692782 RepID=UPI00187E731D|nr:MULTISPECIES: PAS domain-containing protein [unclassified Coleofasciculus]MBE9127236.1 PAS domain-containing protein [Coleofasciculus sp. LEGE 07081]MBE9150612.1 PAS domain-containing protein [Coleofasciculus sp. LEGE 07092]
MTSSLSQKLNRNSCDGRQKETLAMESFWLYERALTATNCGIVISDARQVDHPIIYCNPAFEKITGYSQNEVIGRNCRFLQGADTDPEAVAQIRQSLRSHQEVRVVLKNYRKDGTPFWNELTISPIQDAKGCLTHFIGIQTDVTERHQAQEELRRSNAFLTAQQEADPEGVVVMDEKRMITSYNRHFCQMWNIPEAVIESSDREKLLECILPLISEPLKVFSVLEYLDQNPSLTQRDEILLKDGRVFERYLAPVRSPTGIYYGRIWSFRDITEGKQTELRLRQQATREKLLSGMNQRIRQSLNLDEVLNTAVTEVRHFLACDRTLIYRFNPDWTGTITVESVGEKWSPTQGVKIEDNCFKKTQASFYQKGHISAVEDIYNADLTPCHIKLLEQFQVHANLVVPLLQGDKVWGLLIAHQCSGTRQWQKEEIECLKQLSVQLSVAIQQAALFEQLADELRERQAAEAALRESEANLKQKAAELEKTLYELKQTQLQLIQSEKMSSLGQLVAGVAHELNNPITFISGNLTHANYYVRDLLELVQLYDQHYPQPVPEIAALTGEFDLEFLKADFPKLLHSMDMGVNRIRAIVNSLRNFSRLDEADHKAVDIQQGIENTLLILQHRLNPEKSNIQLVKEYGNLPSVECYPGQLNQVFMNLLNNAIDVLEEAEEERITPGTGEQFSTPTIWIRTEVSKQNSIIIRIADNGSGIPQELQERIFDPFFTTKAVGEGTGLGLSISYQIVVEKHGGKLQCFSEPGEGTEFVVEIPLIPFTHPVAKT